MTSSATYTSRRSRFVATGAMLGLALAGITAAPKPANARWHGYGWGVGIYAPPIVVAPPAYYPPTARAWIPAHWENGYWVGGHWG